MNKFTFRIEEVTGILRHGSTLLCGGRVSSKTTSFARKRKQHPRQEGAGVCEWSRPRRFRRWGDAWAVLISMWEKQAEQMAPHLQGGSCLCRDVLECADTEKL